MNCTDRIATGLTLIAGGVWLDAAGLPGAVVPVAGFHVYALGVAVFGLGMLGAGRHATEARQRERSDR
ncbi:hypothetical protein ABZ671_00465 [Micromonospora sp. NPDC006766]|uniref:hypothetical protein n=1 Tax=Micromonospora sp. NPDC006766 TaxID=3154778 RepID=UPI0033FCEA58